MVQLQSILHVLDNCGATKVRCISVLNKQKNGIGKVGHFLVCSVRESVYNSKVPIGSVRRAILVNQRKLICWTNGIYYRNAVNGVVLVDTSGNPIGNRIKGILPRSFRQNKLSKLLYLSTHIL